MEVTTLKEEEYNQIRKSIYYIRYHLVLCPRYRRKIFNIPSLETRFKELTSNSCKEFDIEILKIVCKEDYCYLHIDVPPNISPQDVIKLIKKSTSTILRNEFEEISQMPNLWTRSYFASTANTVSLQKIQEFINIQPKR